MNRREFTALIAAGLLFPRKIIQAAVPSEYTATTDANLGYLADDDHPQYYSFCFSCKSLSWRNPSPVYELWQPGIVIGMPTASDDKYPVRVYKRGNLPTPLQVDDRTYAFLGAIPCQEFDTLTWALKNAPSFSLVVFDGIAQPYRAVGELDRPWVSLSAEGRRESVLSHQPLILQEGNCQALVEAGSLEACKPFTTLKAWSTYYG